MVDKPWVSGPAEVLEHGLQHLEADTDLDRRLALIAVDNAVELAIKTYLTLPRRVVGSPGLSRKDQAQLEDGFPTMLDALEQHAGTLLVGVQLDEIEFYHRLRNQLYHGGTGLTVEREKVAMYADLARVLFRNLLGYEVDSPDKSSKGAMDFLIRWAALDSILVGRAVVSPNSQGRMSTVGASLEILSDDVDPDLVQRIAALNAARNEFVHSGTPPKGMSVTQMNAEAADLYSTVRKLVDTGKLQPSQVVLNTPNSRDDE